MFISFEGGEGSGKTTQIKLLKDDLENKGHTVITTREPGGTAIGDQIRSILLNPDNDTKISNDADILLYMGIRAQHCQEVIIPNLKKGNTVICDRFIDSTLVYQGLIRNKDIHTILRMHTYIPNFKWPDITILMNTSPDITFNRSRFRNKETNNTEVRFDNKDIDFHWNVYHAYLTLTKVFKNRISIIDERPCDTTITLHNEIVNRINKKMNIK